MAKKGDRHDEQVIKVVVTISTTIFIFVSVRLQIQVELLVESRGLLRLEVDKKCLFAYASFLCRCDAALHSPSALSILLNAWRERGRSRCMTIGISRDYPPR